LGQQGIHFRESDMAASKSGSDYFPHQDAARPSDLLKILGQELREHYELPHDLQHGMLTMLRKLSDGGGSSALRTRGDKYRALAEGA
jgi:hypothetical protein